MLTYKMESLIIYYVVMGGMCLMFCSFFPICKKFQKKKHIYKWLYVVPYGEAILAMFLCFFLFNNNFEKDGLFFLTLTFMLLPFVHMFIYCCIPYYKKKMPRNKALQLIAFILVYVVAIVGVLNYIKMYIILFQ